MTTDDLDLERAADEGMYEREPPASLVIAATGSQLPNGTRVRSLIYVHPGAGLEGTVIGFDGDLGMVLVRFDDSCNPFGEAVDTGEYEIIHDETNGAQ